MRGLDKWRKDALELVSKMDLERAVEFIRNEYYHECDYCVCKDDATMCCLAEDCETVIKKYLESEVEE